MTERRVYLLNEQHELPGDKRGGGRAVRYKNADLHVRGPRLAHALRQIASAAPSALDPVAREHHFLVAEPARDLVVTTTRKGAEVDVPKVIAFGGVHASVFARLRLDLIAKQPVLLVTWAWDPPVNSAAPDLWRYRNVTLTLRDHEGRIPKRRKLRTLETRATLRSRSYDLSAEALAAKAVVAGFLQATSTTPPRTASQALPVRPLTAVPSPNCPAQ